MRWRLAAVCEGRIGDSGNGGYCVPRMIGRQVPGREENRRQGSCLRRRGTRSAADGMGRGSEMGFRGLWSAIR
jgi:hypothetical protein